MEEEVVPIVQPGVSTGRYTPVLVLNQDWSPLAIARVPRALTLIGNGKAEVLEHGVAPITTPTCSVPRPSVIRLITFVSRPRPHVRYTRQNLFKRDGFTCQYCFKRTKELTIDHVIPISRGGSDTWNNVVTSCRACNHRKGARTPQEAHMLLRTQPYEPKISSYLHLIGADVRPEWTPFLPQVA